jgi:hypothetical protein
VAGGDARAVGRVDRHRERDRVARRVARREMGRAGVARGQPRPLTRSGFGPRTSATARAGTTRRSGIDALAQLRGVRLVDQLRGRAP